MMLSDAMRAGAARYPQAYHDFAETDPRTGAITAVCAMGAMAAGIFGAFTRCHLDGALRALFTLKVMNTLIDCPKCGQRSRLSDIIFHLNDVHAEPTERIADWLASLGL
jgi:hypothetical protein